MKKPKLLITLYIAGAITFLVDILYIIFSVCVFSLLISGKIFALSYFSPISLVVIIFNSLFVCMLGVYLVFRKY